MSLTIQFENSEVAGLKRPKQNGGETPTHDNAYGIELIREAAANAYQVEIPEDMHFEMFSRKKKEFFRQWESFDQEDQIAFLQRVSTVSLKREVSEC